MSKRIITLGTWDGHPIEWCVLKKKEFGTLVISKREICKRSFSTNSSDSNNWIKSDLRHWLNHDFFHTAFTIEEKKRIINFAHKCPSKAKDNIMILTKAEVGVLLNADNDDYEKEHYHDCSYCTWTCTTNENFYSRLVSVGYGTGCWCNKYPGEKFAVRPVMYVIEEDACEVESGEDQKKRNDGEVKSGEDQQKQNAEIAGLINILKKMAKTDEQSI